MGEVTLIVLFGLLALSGVWWGNERILHKLSDPQAASSLMPVRITPRAEWQDHKPTRTPIIIPPAKRFGAVLHFFGPVQGRHITNGLRIAQGAVDWHVNHNKWSDGAYSYIVDNEGNIYELRGLMWDQFGNGEDEVGPDDGTDRQWYTIAWVGGDGGDLDNPHRDKPSPEAEAAITWLIGYLREKGAGDRVLPHSDFKRKSCPGDELTQLARSLDEQPIDGASTPNEEGTQVLSTEDLVDQIPPGGLRVQDPYINLTVVGMVQARLDALGYDIGEEGIDFHYGVDTAAAVKRFEKRSGFKDANIDGVMGKGGFRRLMRPDAAPHGSVIKRVKTVPDSVVQAVAEANEAIDHAIMEIGKF